MADMKVFIRPQHTQTLGPYPGAAQAEGAVLGCEQWILGVHPTDLEWWPLCRFAALSHG